MLYTKKLVIPKNIKISKKYKNLRIYKIKIKGPLGKLVFFLNSEKIRFSLIHNFRILKLEGYNKREVMTIVSLINNAFLGVDVYFKKLLRLEGLGYKVLLDKKQKSFFWSIGQSHIFQYLIPNLNIRLYKLGKILRISSVNKQYLGNEAFKIKSLKKPDVYKLKGIQIMSEKLRIKVQRQNK